MEQVHLDKTVEVVTYDDLRILEERSQKENPKLTVDFYYRDLKFIPQGNHYYDVYRKDGKKPIGTVGNIPVFPVALVIDGNDIYYINQSLLKFFK